MPGSLTPLNGQADSSATGYASPPPAWLPGHDEDEGEGLQLGRLFAAIKRFKWLVLTMAIVGTTLGVVATRFLHAEYEARATVWLGSGTAGVEDMDRRAPIRAVDMLGSGGYLELMTSFAVIDRVVDKMHLYLGASAPDSLAFSTFRPTAKLRAGSYKLSTDSSGRRYSLYLADGTLLERGTVGDSVGRPVGFAWQPTAIQLGARRELLFGVASPRQVAVGLVGALQTSLSDRSSFLRVSLSGASPQRTTRILNTWLEEFVTTAAELKRRNLTELANVLDQQRAIASSNLRSAEGALQSFRVRSITEPSDAANMPGGVRDPVMNGYFSERADLENARADRAALERTMSEAAQGPSLVAGLWALPTVLQRVPELKTALTSLYEQQAKLATLRQVYTDEHKSVQDVLANVSALQNQTIPNLARSTDDRLRREESELSRRIAGQTQDLRNIPTRTIEESRRRRDLALAENQYNTLQSRSDAVRLAWQSATPDVSVLDWALASQRPTKNRAPIIILFAFASSIALGSALAIGADRLDHRFRYPEQAMSELGLEILGAIPSIKKSEQVSTPEEMSNLVEAFRTLRMQVMNTTRGRRTLMLTITSPGMGDGKTTVASNLALSFAEAGHRTLLIDGDTRLGQLHSIFEVERRPGLIDLLLEETTQEQALRPIAEHPNLTVMPSGVRRHRGPELLASDHMTALINRLAPLFDVILVDSPPLGAGIDPFALGISTGNLLVVLRTGTTDRHMAQAKMQLLQRLPTRVIGAVLNDINADGAYKHYAYLGGYYATQDDDAPPPRIASGA
ncbi:MAG: polysaccharide biosynthesis tyrosine autokinase [Gemmatimonadaceae bacterium]